MSETPVLECHGISKQFGGLLALSEVTTRVAPGQIKGIIGPNGAGKTTLFNVISGLMRASSGQLLFRGELVAEPRSDQLSRRGLIRTFQNVRLFSHLPVLDNVMLGGQRLISYSMWGAVLRTPLMRREEAELRDRARECLKTVGLSGLEQHRPHELSYGQQRLVEIARALCACPKLLLLDEPAAGMNDQETRHLLDLIRKVNDGGVTCMLIEHNLDMVTEICSELLVLNYGKVLAEGPTQEVTRNPEVIHAYMGRAAG